jgi:uncharacterized protein YjbI with pentapeptide repeats
MEPIYQTDKTFENLNFTLKPLPKGEYEHCIFKHCEFANTDLSEQRFTSCTFLACHLSLAKLTKTSFTDAKFQDCKMLGLLFYHCNSFTFSVRFDNCNLSHSSFFQNKLKNTSFLNSKLIEVDFTEADLSSSIFDRCDLANAKFENTLLEKVDFRTAYNFSIDPNLNRIRKAKFLASNITGLLDKFDLIIEP